MLPPLSVVELFAGAGGAALGLQRAGWGPSVMVESNQTYARTLVNAARSGRLKGLILQADVRDVNLQRYDGAGLLWSSWPCQPFSSAGFRYGALDPRNGWPWTLRCIDQVVPRWFVGENVPGLIRHRAECDVQSRGVRDNPLQIGACPGCYSDEVIEADLNLRFASVERHVLDAADFGVPQRRQRVFFIAGPRPVGAPRKTHASLAQARRSGLKPWVGLGQALEHDPWGHLEPVYSGWRASELKTLSPEYRRELEEIGHDDWACSLCAVPLSSGACFCPLPHQAEEILESPAPTIAGGSERGHVGGGSVLSATAITRDKLHWALVRYHRARDPQVRQARQIMDLEPLEQETTYVGVSVSEVKLLMGFPPDWPLAGSNQRQYRQLANAVVPAVAEAIGRAILRVDKSSPRLHP